MHDLFPPFRGQVLRARSAFVGEHRDNLSSKTLLVKLERFLALTLEQKIRIHLHGSLLSPNWCSTNPFTRNALLASASRAAVALEFATNCHRVRRSRSWAEMEPCPARAIAAALPPELRRGSPPFSPRRRSARQSLRAAFPKSANPAPQAPDQFPFPSTDNSLFARRSSPAPP